MTTTNTARQWPSDVDLTPGKRIGIVLSWCDSTYTGTIKSLNLNDGGYTLAKVSAEHIKTGLKIPCLIVGEEIEHNIVNMDGSNPYAINVSGPQNSFVQMGSLHSDLIGSF